MHFTLLLTQSLDSPGGGGRYLPLAKALVRRGHVVKMVLLHHDFGAAPTRHFWLDGVEIEYVAQMHVRKRDGQKQYFSPWLLPWIAALATLRLAWAALRSPTDALVVCKTQPMNGLAAWLAHTLRRTPVYLDADDWETLNNRFQHPWQQRIVAWFERWLPSFAAGITVNTRFIAEQFVALGYPPSHLRLLPNSVERERFRILQQPDLPATLTALREQWKIRPTDRTIVYVGSLSLHNHALDLLLDAFARLLLDEPDALLLLVGGGEDRERLETIAASLGIQARIRFMGRVSLEEAPLYYRLGEFSVAPMWDTPTARSSLSIKLAESIFAGVPCLTADIGDYAARVGAAGYAVSPSPLAFAEGMLTLLRDQTRLDAMRVAAHTTRDAYAWDTLLDDFLSLFPSALRRP